MQNHPKVKYCGTENNEKSPSQSPFSSPTTISSNTSHNLSPFEQHTICHFQPTYVQNYVTSTYDTNYVDSRETKGVTNQSYYYNDQSLYNGQETKDHQQVQTFAQPWSAHFVENTVSNSFTSNKLPISGESLSSPSTSASSSSASCASISPLSSSSSSCSNPTPNKKAKSTKTRLVSDSPNDLHSISTLESSSPFSNQSLSQVKVELSNSSLWQKFDSHTTEMIITKQGRQVPHLNIQNKEFNVFFKSLLIIFCFRRMFPTLQYMVKGLDPCAKYNVFVDMVLVESSSLKFQAGKWICCGTSSGQTPINEMGSKGKVYLHPDSPNTGAFWAKNEIVFGKLKLTNNKLNPDGHILLQSMHKYLPRLHISPALSKNVELDLNNLHTFTFNETKFVAVTAYQNTDVSRDSLFSTFFPLYLKSK